MRGRAVVGNVAGPVVAAVVARLADTGGQRGFVFVHVPNDGTDITLVKEVVIVVGDAAADSVFGVVADTGFQFVALDFGHVDFDGNAVALQLIEVGLYGRAGIVAVLLERLLQVEDFVQVVRRTGVETCHAGNHALRVAACAGDLEIAKVNGAVALHNDVQVGFLGIGIDGGLGGGEFRQRIFFTCDRAEDGGFTRTPAILVEVFANGLLPVFHRILVVLGQVVVIQYVAKDGYADVVDFGARAGDDVDSIALAVVLNIDVAVEVAFGPEHGFDVVGCLFGEEADLFFVQLFFLLLGNQRQVFFKHFFDFAVLGVDFDGEFGLEFACLVVFGLLGHFGFGNSFVVFRFGNGSIYCQRVSVGERQ